MLTSQAASMMDGRDIPGLSVADALQLMAKAVQRGDFEEVCSRVFKLPLAECKHMRQSVHSVWPGVARHAQSNMCVIHLATHIIVQPFAGSSH